MERRKIKELITEEAILEVQDGNHGEKHPTASDYVEEGIPFLMARDFRDGQVDLRGACKIPKALGDQLRIGFAKTGDVLLTHKGSIGLVAIVPQVPDYVMLTPQVTYYRTNSKRLLNTYLKYAFQAPFFRNQLESFSAQSTRPYIGITAQKELELEVAPLPVQRRIAGILSAYDELIENSQRRIRILEAMARVRYRETLQSQAVAVATKPIVDRTYWRFISENVGKYPDMKRYYATADVDGLAITGPGIEYSFSEKPSRAQKQPLPHSVWFARMKDTYKIAWYGAANAGQAADSILSSGFAGFEARDPTLWPLLFLTISSKDFHVQKDLYCTGATQMSLTNEGLGRIEMPVPLEEPARRLGSEVGPMLNSMLILQQRNEVLRRTRDLLLPRLLSGQLEVEAA